MRINVMLLLALVNIVIPVEAKMPDMVCNEVAKLYMSPSNFETVQSAGDTLFRVKDNKLFLSSPDRKEYFYNEVTEQEYGRFLSGHKTIIFGLDEKFHKGLVIHSNEVEIYVSRIHCTTTK